MKDKTGLVLEGGAMRGIFTAGALDYLLKRNFYFDYIVGVSAGAGNAMNYVSRQIGRTRRVILQDDAENYYGAHQMIKNRKLLNLDTLVQQYAQEDIPYDFDTLFATNTDYEVVVTNCQTGKAEYRGNYQTEEEFFLCNKATCAVPFICDPIVIDGCPYLDGSIADSIPVQRALEQGCDKLLVILTKPKGDSPTDYGKMKKLIDNRYKQYPAFCEAMLRRTEVYEQQEKLLYELQAEGKAYILRPTEKSVKRFEKSKAKLQTFYRQGYELMEEHFTDYLQFLGYDKEVVNL